MNAQIDTIVCIHCQASNKTGVRFCAQCGQSPAVAPAVAADSLQSARDGLTRINARLLSDDGHSSIGYHLEFRDGLLAGPLPMQFAGRVTVLPGNPAAPEVTARMLPQSQAIQFGVLTLCAIALGFVPKSILPDEIFLGSCVIALGLGIWVAYFEGPKRVRARILQAIQATVPGPSVEAAATPTSSKLVPPPASAADDLFAQLNRLAELQAAGLLSAEEFSAKKAQLLAKI